MNLCVIAMSTVVVTTVVSVREAHNKLNYIYFYQKLRKSGPNLIKENKQKYERKINCYIFVSGGDSPYNLLIFL